MRLLNRQLVIWFGVSLVGGALLWNGGALKAQNNPVGPPPIGEFVEKWDREQAAGLFVDFLDAQNSGSPMNWQDYSVISAKSRRELGDSLNEVMLELAEQWRSKQQNVKTLVAKGKTAIMEVEVAPASIRPLVLVEENGGWTVDVVETYAGWNKLESLSRAQALAQLKANIGTNSTRNGGDTSRSVCMARLSQLARGLSMYAQDYDEKLPEAKKWTSSVLPYIVNQRLFKCPSETRGNSFAFNGQLSTKVGPLAPKNARFVLLYETIAAGKNFGHGENRAYRHQNGANYAFADGHVKWLPKTVSPDFTLKP